MSQNTEREAFEARWPTPSGVAWIDAAGGYGAVSDRALGLMTQQARWEGWQARAALASQQAGKLEPDAIPDSAVRAGLKAWIDNADHGARVAITRMYRAMRLKLLADASPPSREPLYGFSREQLEDMRLRFAVMSDFYSKMAVELIDQVLGIHSREGGSNG